MTTGNSVALTVDVPPKARIIASLIVGGMIALIMLAFSSRGNYGVIEEERVSIMSVEALDLQAGYGEDTEQDPDMMLRQTVLYQIAPFDEASYTSTLTNLYR